MHLLLSSISLWLTGIPEPQEKEVSCHWIMDTNMWDERACALNPQELINL